MRWAVHRLDVGPTHEAALVTDDLTASVVVATVDRRDDRPWHGARRDGGTAGSGGAAMSDDEDDGTTYDVVVNHEEQYSIWPSDRSCRRVAEGGHERHQAACLDHIEVVWTDMRPEHVRAVRWPDTRCRVKQRLLRWGCSKGRSAIPPFDLVGSGFAGPTRSVLRAAEGPLRRGSTQL